MQRIAVIADDLTGATDVAAAFADAGFRATVVFSEAEAISFADAQVVAVSTNSRQLPPDAAKRRVRRAWRALTATGPRLLYKKLDSTVKGNVVAEVEALRLAGKYSKALVCPANPGQGRCIRHGVLSVRGEFLADLRSHFAGQGLREATFLNRPVTLRTLAAALQKPGVAAVVADADCDHDLATLVRGALRFTSRVLLAGSAGMAGQLARLLRPRGARGRRPPSRKGRMETIILSGTRNPVTGAQVKTLAAETGATILELADANALLLQALLASGVPVVVKVPIYAQSDVVILRQLRKLTSICHGAEPRLFVVTGGDTTRLVCRWLRPHALEMRGELLPGLAWGRIRGGLADGLSLCTKPGGFGEHDSLVRAVQGFGS